MATASADRQRLLEQGSRLRRVLGVEEFHAERVVQAGDLGGRQVVGRGDVIGRDYRCIIVLCSTGRIELELPDRVAVLLGVRDCLGRGDLGRDVRGIVGSDGFLKVEYRL